MFNFFKKNSSGTTYLKMRNGKVIDTDTAYPSKEMSEFEKKDDDFFRHNRNVEAEAHNNKVNTKSKIFIGIGLFCISVPVCIIGYHLISNSFSNVTKFMKEDVSQVKTVNKDSSLSKDVKDSTNAIGKDSNLVNKYKNLMDITNSVNQNIKNSYNQLKDGVVSYKDYQFTYLDFIEILDNIKDNINSNKNSLIEQRASFEDNDWTELFDIYINRYNNLNSLICSFEKQLNKDTIVDETNKSILSDNTLLNNETSILKNYLSTSNIDYSESDSELKIVDKK